MSLKFDPVLPSESLILVTGANGFIACHVVDQLLRLGYKVRGTVRDAVKASWIPKVFEQKYGEGLFELSTVKDFVAPDAFDEAMKGVAGVIHVASSTTFSPDPNTIITPTVAGAVNALKAAAAQPSVQRFVLTSSFRAAFFCRPNEQLTITVNDFEEEAIQAAWSADKSEASSPLHTYKIYSAGKAQAELETWRWYQENKPDLVFNAVLPDFTSGRPVSPENQGYGTTSGMVRMLFESRNVDMISWLPPQHYVDVEDAAILHVAALIHPDVNDERVFGGAGPQNWNTILSIFRKMYPKREFIPDVPSLGQDLSSVPSDRAEQLLREMGRNGWVSLEDSLRANTKDLGQTYL